MGNSHNISPLYFLLRGIGSIDHRAENSQECLEIIHNSFPFPVAAAQPQIGTWDCRHLRLMYGEREKSDFLRRLPYRTVSTIALIYK